MQNSNQQNTFREVPGGARHKAVKLMNSLQSGCAERFSKYVQTGAPVTEQGYDSIPQSDPRLGGKKSGTAELFVFRLFCRMAGEAVFCCPARASETLNDAKYLFARRVFVV